MSEPPPSDDDGESGRIVRRPSPAERAGWLRWLPGLLVLRHYRGSWLRHDIVAGIVLTTMLVPFFFVPSVLG